VTYDVIIVGGSYAGIAAALQLARARRQVLVVDAGQRRNRFAATAHGLLGHDGHDPAAIAADARAQLMKYPTVSWRDDAAVEARADGDGFVVALAGGDTLTARRLVLASGMVDELPDVPGLAERWGVQVFACPYCHGYELDRGRLGVLAAGPMSIHHALLVSEWGPTTLFIGGTGAGSGAGSGAVEPDAEQLAMLARREVTLERTAVAAVAGAADLRLVDGRVVALAGLFIMPTPRIANPLVAQLGCELDANPVGVFVKTDLLKETTVRKVFACGDLATGMPALALAVADGTRAGIAAHQSLVFR